MNNSVLLAIAVCCLLVITGIVAYDFVQKQQAIESLKPHVDNTEYNRCLSGQQVSVLQAMSNCERYK